MGRIESLEALLARGPDGALLRYSLGLEHHKAGQLGDARTHLERAVALDPGYSAAWKLLGKVCAEAGDAGAAMSAYRTGVAAAERKGDVQAAKEMRVFLARLERSTPGPPS
jgi:predicted Zn-dependent protease